MVVLNVLGILIGLLVTLDIILNVLESSIALYDYARATASDEADRLLDKAMRLGLHATVGVCGLLVCWRIETVWS